MSAAFWMGIVIAGSVLIGLGGIAATLGNLRYAQVKEQENKARLVKEEEARRKVLAEKALDLLLPEIRENLILVQKSNSDKKSFLINKLQATAWQTVSGSEIVTGIEPETLKKILKVYQLIADANDYHERITGYKIGIESALQGKQKIERFLEGQLDSTLKALEPLLKDLSS